MPALPQTEDAARHPFETAEHFRAAYASGAATPSQVAERVLAVTAELDALDPKMRIVLAQDAEDLRRQALASTARWKAGRPLGALDGVPVAVKDELDLAGYPTTVGTSFQGRRGAAADDAEVVRRLRLGGALLLGKVNMHELGMGVTGQNPHHGHCRNPYAPGHVTGGSSSGSAAAVAAGLCPIAIGADGGGSIRIPAALCGVVGLKPTYGRVSELGAAPLCWSVAHVGPLGATARDVALAYAAMAGPTADEPNTWHAPAVSLEGFDAPDLRGLRVGLFTPWFEDCDAQVAAICRRMVSHLQERGASAVEISLRTLVQGRAAHLVTIVSEMLASQAASWREDPRRYAPETRLNLAIASHLTNSDYIHAQRHRVEVVRDFLAALEQVDVIATPTTATTAPAIAPAALRHGQADVGLADRLMRYCAISNLTGLPAISFPAGFDAAGLPVGLQLIGRPWAEATLLRCARIAESALERTVPQVHRRLLD